MVACVIDIICLSTVDELCCALFDDFIHLTLRHMLFTMFLSIILSFHISTISATFLFIIKIYAFLISHLLGFWIRNNSYSVAIFHQQLWGYDYNFYQRVCMALTIFFFYLISVYLRYFAHFFDAVCSLLFDNFWHLCI